MTTNSTRIVTSQWFAFLYFIPFTILLCVREFLGLSDALLAQAAPGERETHLLNWAMVGAFLLGIFAFMVHEITLGKRGPVCLFAKLLAVLAACHLVFALLS